MKPINSSERIVCNIRTASFKPFVTDGRELPGHSFLQLDETFQEVSGFHIYKMAPGTTSQPHEHTCHEQFLVIDGDMVDNDGTVYGPGDFVLLKAGTQHSSTTTKGCTLAVFIRTVERNL